MGKYAFTGIENFEGKTLLFLQKCCHSAPVENVLSFDVYVFTSSKY